MHPTDPIMPIVPPPARVVSDPPLSFLASWYPLPLSVVLPAYTPLPVVLVVPVGVSDTGPGPAIPVPWVQFISAGPE